MCARGLGAVRYDGVLCMESSTHTSLKRLAVAWLRAQGYFAAACEVRSPIAQWVLDVAGWRDGVFDPALNRRVKCDPPHTVIIECKQSRADFLRDSRRLDRLLALRERLEGIRRSIEEHRIKALEPQLRVSGSSLFADMEQWDFAASALPSYRRTLDRLLRLDEHVHGQTKFFRLARYGLADALYVAAPQGMLTRRELPPGWGLLECEEGTLRDSDRLLREPTPTLFSNGAIDPASLFTIRIEAAALPARPHHRQRLLRNIAVAASTQAIRGSTMRATPQR